MLGFDAMKIQSQNSNNIYFWKKKLNNLFLASSGVRSPKQSVSESLPDEDQGQQEEGQDASAATSPKPKVDEASKKGESHQKFPDMIHSIWNFIFSNSCYQRKNEFRSQKGIHSQRSRTRRNGNQME